VFFGGLPCGKVKIMNHFEEEAHPRLKHGPSAGQFRDKPVPAVPAQTAQALQAQAAALGSFDEPEVSAEVAEHRRLAAAADQEAHDSFERCDTDGFLSQWASGLMAQQHRLAATIAENGGRHSFQALFDTEGNLVPAKLVPTKFGTSWGVLEGDDPQALAAKGYREGRVMAPARAEMQGSGRGLSGTAWVAAVRSDGGFSRDVEVLSDGSAPAPDVSAAHGS
jgi:hypothetical protein